MCRHPWRQVRMNCLYGGFTVFFLLDSFASAATSKNGGTLGGDNKISSAEFLSMLKKPTATSPTPTTSTSMNPTTTTTTKPLVPSIPLKVNENPLIGPVFLPWFILIRMMILVWRDWSVWLKLANRVIETFLPWVLIWNGKSGCPWTEMSRSAMPSFLPGMMRNWMRKEMLWAAMEGRAVQNRNINPVE